MIEINNLKKTYSNNKSIFKDIDLLINKGEFCILTGKSGSGKTTFLKMLLSEEKPTGGNITVGGIDLMDLNKKDVPEYRRRLGFVFQDYKLIENISVYENIEIALKINKKEKEEIKKEVKKLLKIVNLEDKIHEYPWYLSGGEKQRLAIARAIANRPNVIIADEPTGNLDDITSKEIVTLLKKINKFGTTVIMATHDSKIIEFAYPDKIYQIKDKTIELIKKNEKRNV